MPLSVLGHPLLSLLFSWGGEQTASGVFSSVMSASPQSPSFLNYVTSFLPPLDKVLVTLR